LPLGPAAFAPPVYSASSEEEPSRVRKLMPLFVVLGAAGAGGLAIWIAVLVNRPPASKHEDKPAAAEHAVNEPRSVPADKAEKPPAAEAAKAPEPEAKPEAEAPAAAAAAAPAPTAEAEKPAAEAQAAPLTKREEEARDRRHAAKAAKAAAANLPAAPSRADVLGAMAKVQPAVVRCMSGTHGIVTADMKIEGPTGRVMSANISGAPGSAGSCIASAVRKAHFPPFSQASMAIRYPMKI
jgi:cytoskeletal protein RodZ